MEGIFVFGFTGSWITGVIRALKKLRVCPLRSGWTVLLRYNYQENDQMWLTKEIWIRWKVGALRVATARLSERCESEIFISDWPINAATRQVSDRFVYVRPQRASTVGRKQLWLN